MVTSVKHLLPKENYCLRIQLTLNIDISKLNALWQYVHVETLYKTQNDQIGDASQPNMMRYSHIHISVEWRSVII